MYSRALEEVFRCCRPNSGVTPLYCGSTVNYLLKSLPLLLRVLCSVIEGRDLAAMSRPG